MLITGLFDKVAKRFVQFVPTPNEGLLKRDFKNAVTQPKSIYNTNAEDFSIIQLVELDDLTGDCLSTEQKLLFTLDELKDDPQVQ